MGSPPSGERPTSDLPDSSRVIRVIRPSGLMPRDETQPTTPDLASKRPKSPEFSVSREDGAMSVFLEDDILAAGRSLEEILTLDMFESGSVLCWLPISFYREQGHAVTRRDIRQFPGHANVRGSNGKLTSGAQTRLAKNSRWLEFNPPSAASPGSVPWPLRLIRWALGRVGI
jgi:hypothetical protein